MINGPINGQTFRIWAEEVLAPVLHSGDIVVLDNLGSYKIVWIEAAMAAAGRNGATCRPTFQISIPLNRSSPK